MVPKKGLPRGKPWAKGESGNPAGRPVGTVNGRARALGMLDQVCGVPANLEKLRDKFQEAFDANPAAFFERFVMPLLPKDVRAEVGIGLDESCLIAVMEAIQGVEDSTMIPPGGA